MLSRVYIDNFRCLVNFDFRPKPLQLILGANGTGKSTVLEVLTLIRELIAGTTKRAVTELFPAETRTRWQTLNQQTFLLGVTGENGSHEYKLVLDPYRERFQRVLLETLEIDGRPLFKFSSGEATLYSDSHEPKYTFTLDWNYSGLATVPDRDMNTKLTWFKNWLASLACVQLDPPRMVARAAGEDRYPDKHLSNFAEWYRHLSLEQPSACLDFLRELRSAIAGFESFDLKEAGQGIRILKANLSPDRIDNGRSSKKGTIAFDFEELSDGQRALAGLYALLYFCLRAGYTICIDEPENYLALAEIEPWLMTLNDFVEESGGQAILVSHHPELIDRLSASHGVSFVRTGLGPVRIENQITEVEGLKPSEVVARGWDVES